MMRSVDKAKTRDERWREFVADAFASDSKVQAGGAIYTAEDVHAWMERLANGEKPRRPAPIKREQSDR